MRFLQAWKSWRQFEKSAWEWRNLVFYSESGQDWHQFSGLIEELNERRGRKLSYVTSDPEDPGLGRRHRNYQAICIPPGTFLTLFFQVCKADVLVLTMMDLGNLHLKRSFHPVHYVYLFHSMGSTHMTDHAGSFDHYDSLFCTGPHQVAEIRRREELFGLPPKHLFDFGHPRLEQVMREGALWQAGHARVAPDGRRAVVLVAPTWGDSSLFNVCGAELIAELLAADFHVIMRPHYQTQRLSPDLCRSLRERFGADPRFEYIGQMGETDSILRSDVLISDWSAMAQEYALGLDKPVLFVDVPRRVRNPDWQKLGIEPIESAIRERIGTVISPSRLNEVASAIRQLLERRDEFAERMKQMREQQVFRLGHSIPDGADEIIRLADLGAANRLQRGGPGG